jgi:hypothetical protein
MMVLATWSKRTSALAISKSGEAIRGGYNTAKAAFHLELIRKVMRKKLLLFLAVLFCVSGMSVPVVNAQVNVSIGVSDRPYYVHGPGYWNGRAYYAWAPGYWGWRHHHRYWHHGYYRYNHRRWW